MVEEEEETNWKVTMSFAQVNRSAFFSFFSSSVHIARPQSEALLFLTTETYSIWLLCSQFHLLFAQISALHSGLSVQFSYCSAQPAIHLVFHMLQNLSVTWPTSCHCWGFFFFFLIYLSISSGVEIESLEFLRTNSGVCFFYPPHSKIHYVTSKLCDVKTMIFQLNLHIRHVGSVAGRHLWPVSKDFVDVGMKIHPFSLHF